MKCYWWNGCPNLGDLIGPAILRHAGYAVTWAAPDLAEIVTAGSIIGALPAGWPGTVLGSGTIEPCYHNLSRARVLAVRGALTREICDLPPRTPLGDPAILAPDLVAGHVRPHGTVVVPHYIDEAIAARHPEATVVDVCGPLGAVLEAIRRSVRVISSSLHALIVADAFGVPHVFEPHPAVIGGRWKFDDYASAFGERIEPGLERLTDRAAMADRQGVLRSLIGGLA